MRRLVTLLFLLSTLMVWSGCGGKPDPRDNPDFKDDTDPSVTGTMLNEDPEKPQ
jgi:hypothetical protein